MIILKGGESVTITYKNLYEVFNLSHNDRYMSSVSFDHIL